MPEPSVVRPLCRRCGKRPVRSYRPAGLCWDCDPLLTSVLLERLRGLKSSLPRHPRTP